MAESDYLETDYLDGDSGEETAPAPAEKKGKKVAAKKKEKADDAAAQNLSFDDQGRVKALEAALSDLTKRFGDGTIVRLGDAAHLAVEVIPSGSLTTDIALGVGGIPRGRITEIYGPESSGKTTLCLHVIAEAQKRGGLCAFVDMEHALDPAYAERIGVNVDTLYVSQPDTGEQALEITEALVRSGALDVVVVDSVAALVPRAEIEGEMGDAFVGLQARLMSQALRKLSGAIKHSNVAVLFTNQLREKVGVMFGSPETTSGGRALKFYASVRLDIRRIQSIKQGGESIGNRVKVRVTKNKVAAPFREAEFDMMFYEGGISKVGEIVDLGVELGIIDKRGAFFRYNDGLLGQGRESAKQFLLQNPAVSNEIEQAIRLHFGLPPIS
ncbi:MAG: DNA recombination/repair protein RecA [Chloroflexota bacterium]|nr:MAG: DNA recombination/repair protein RecA [Chloroflexota bacterium]